jgi:hypothetical protein
VIAAVVKLVPTSIASVQPIYPPETDPDEDWMLPAAERVPAATLAPLDLGAGARVIWMLGAVGALALALFPQVRPVGLPPDVTAGLGTGAILALAVHGVPSVQDEAGALVLALLVLVVAGAVHYGLVYLVAAAAAVAIELRGQRRAPVVAG